MNVFTQSETEFCASLVPINKTMELFFSPNSTELSDSGLSFKVKLLVALSVLFISREFIKSIKQSRNKYYKIPGPSSLPLIGCLHHKLLPNADLFNLGYKWFRKYKRIMKVKLFHLEGVAVLDPSYIQKILASTDKNYLNKHRLVYDAAAGYTLSNGVVFSEYPVWHHHRKVLSRTFSYSGIQDQLTKMNFHTKKLIKDLLDASKNNQIIDGVKGISISKLLNTTALEIILHIIMDLEITSEEERLEFHKHLQSTKHGFSRRLKQPWLLFQPIYWLHPLRREIDKSVGEIKGFMKVIRERYEKRRENQKDNSAEANDSEFGVTKPVKCMMEEMMDAGFSDDDIFQETVTMIYAGHETSSWGIIFFLFRLALNPEIQHRCREEIDELFEKSSVNRDLTIGDLTSFDYLDRCVKESLRLYPIVPTFSRRLDAPLQLEEDLVLEKGLIVAFSPWFSHRDPDVYPNPEKFDPDRFLPEERAKRHPYSYLPFSAGPRNCLGWKVAPLTMKLVVAYILRDFEVETTQKLEDLQFNFDITLGLKNDINLIFKKRHM